MSSKSVYETSSSIDISNFPFYNYFICDCSGGSITIDLIDSSNGYYLEFYRIDSNLLTSLTLNAPDGVDINGSSSIIIGPGKYVQILIHDGNYLAICLDNGIL